MTKMIRPFTIKDEKGTSITIDALAVTDFDVFECMLTIEHQYQEHLHFPSKSNSEIFRMFNAKLYEALNDDVLATEEVLKDLPEGEAFYIQDKDGERRFIEKNTRNKNSKTHRWQHRGQKIEDVASFHRIVGGDATSQDYLRNFYTDGTPVVVK